MADKEHKCYTVLSVCEDDFNDWDENYPDEVEQKQLVESMTDNEWRMLAGYMGDYMWDGDKFAEAKAESLHKIAEGRADREAGR